MDKTQYSQYKNILLFFSGGLDTSFLLKYFTHEVGAEVVSVCFDLGGDQIEVATIAERAKSLGAKKHILLDARRVFVEEYCFKAIKANAIFESAHPLSSSLSRPLMAKLGVDLAKKYGCAAIMHGSNGWQNNSARFDTAIRVLTDSIEIVEPIMENNVSREFEYDYLRKMGMLISKKEDDLRSSDNNLWGREIEDGVLAQPEVEPKDNIYRLTVSPEKAPDKAEYVELAFDQGVPTKLNGIALPPLELVEKLNQTGGVHGVGRHDALEDKIIGIKIREIHESPAATILIKAHKDLESSILPRRTLTIKNFVDQQWTELACFGLWHHPLREALEAFINKASANITGTVRLKLYKGSIQIVGRKSSFGLYQMSQNDKILKSYERIGNPNRNYYDYYAYEAKIANLRKEETTRSPAA